MDPICCGLVVFACVGGLYLLSRSSSKDKERAEEPAVAARPTPDLVYRDFYRVTGQTTVDEIQPAAGALPAWPVREALLAAACRLIEVQHSAQQAVGSVAVDFPALEHWLDRARESVSATARRIVVLAGTYGGDVRGVPPDIRFFVDRDHRELDAMSYALVALRHSLMVAVAAGTDPDGSAGREVRQRIEGIAYAIHRLADPGGQR